MFLKTVLSTLAITAMGIPGTSHVLADDIRFLCYQDASECEVLEELANAFKAESGHTVITETVKYEFVRDQLEEQLQTDAAPDVARITNLGGLNDYYLDLTEYVDTDSWETNYSAVLPWFRKPDYNDVGIYGWMTQLTVTGPYINVTMFDEAGVNIPGEGATWDDWAQALRQVKSELGIHAGLAMDRTAHRIAGPAFSYGAKFFDDDGEPLLVDKGFRSFAKTFVGWHEEGLMPAEGWPAGSGTKYQEASPLFLAGEVAMHLSGSWMINNYITNINDFEWRVVLNPCGPGGCGAMLGGSAIAAFKSTSSPEAAALFVDFLARQENAEKFAAATKNITAHQGLQQTGVDYGDISPNVALALSMFATNAGKSAQTTPQAYTLQGYSKNTVIYSVVPDYFTQAITGEITLDEAFKAIDADIAAKIAE